MTDLAAHLHQLQGESPALLASFDGSGCLRYANAAYREAYGLGDGEQLAWADLMRRHAALNTGVLVEGSGIEAWVEAVLATIGEPCSRVVEAKLQDGRWLLLHENVGADGWMLCVACDITKLRADVRAVRRDRDEALRAAHTDDLTGVANRRFVIGRIEAMLAQSSAVQDGQEGHGGQSRGVLCVLDLDNFKYINDSYGHQAGDAILRDFAGCISGQVRRSDCFGRIGGEEFVLVLPDTGLDEAWRIVERMLGLVRGSRPLPDMPNFSYTFSCGVAAVRPDDDFQAIYGRADKALYAAKMAGRNRVRSEDATARSPVEGI